MRTPLHLGLLVGLRADDMLFNRYKRFPREKDIDRWLGGGNDWPWLDCRANHRISTLLSFWIQIDFFRIRRLPGIPGPFHQV